MFRPGEVANPQGRIKNNTTQMLRDALIEAGKGRHTTPFARIAELFYKSGKMALAILPYITPKLRTLEVSGEVTVPFQFIINRSSGETVKLPTPQAVKQIDSKIVVSPIELDKCKAPTTSAKCMAVAKTKTRKRGNHKPPTQAQRVRTTANELAKPLSQARLSKLITARPGPAANKDKDHE